MPDNIINNNNNSNDNSELLLALYNLVISLSTGFKEQTDRVVKALEKNDKSSTESNKRLEKTIADKLRPISDLKSRAKYGSEDAKAFLQIYEKSIKKLEEYTKHTLTLESKVNPLKAQAKELREAKKGIADKSSPQYKELDKELREINKTLKPLQDELKRAKEQQANDESLKDLETVLKRIKDNQGEYTQEVRKESKKEEKRAAKLDKQQDKNYKQRSTLADNLGSVFEGGLFNLADNFNVALKKQTQDNISALTGSSIGGKIAGFLEKSLFSVMDYQTQKVVEGIQTLQSTFETTGINISKAILVDKDQIASNWADVAERLKSEGYGNVIGVTDYANFQEQGTRAGITDFDLLTSMGYAASKAAASAGVSTWDIFTEENARNLYQIRQRAIQEGKSEEAANKIVEDVIAQLGAQLTTAVKESGSGLGLAQGKAQDLSTRFFESILTNYSGDLSSSIGTSSQKSAVDVALQTLFGEAGGVANFDTIRSQLDSLLSKGVAEGSDLFSILGRTVTAEEYKQSIANGTYVDIYKEIFRNLSDFSNSKDITANTKILQDVFGLDAKSWLNLMDSFGGPEGLIAKMDSLTSEIAKGTESSAFTGATNLVTSGGTTTTEQQLKIGGINDATGAWAFAEQTHIPESAQFLAKTIELGNNAIQTGISDIVNILLNRIIGSGSGSLTEALTTTMSGGFKELGGFAKGGISAIAGISAFIGGWELGTKLDQIFGISDKILSAVDVVPTEESMENLLKIQEENEKKNKDYQEKLIASLDNVLSDTSAIKGNTSNIAGDVTDVNDNKQNYANTLRDYLESNKLQYNDGTDDSLAASRKLLSKSDSELIDFYEANKNSFIVNPAQSEHERADITSNINQARTGYVTALNDLNDTTINTAIKKLMTDGSISSEELGNLKTDIYTLANELEDEASRDSVIKGYTQLENNKLIYDAANALKNLLEAETNSSNAYRLYGTTDKEGIYKTAKQYLLNGNYSVYDWVYARNPVLAMQYNGLWDSVLAYMDPNKAMSTGTLSLASTDNWRTLYNSDNVSKFATGIDYVPYDNYPALLHRGERVQTAAEAQLEARLEDIINAAEYINTNNNLFNDSNNNNKLDTTNNSIKEGFDTNAENLGTVIEALKAILTVLTSGTAFNSNNTESIFTNLNTDKTALRGNNIVRIASSH